MVNLLIVHRKCVVEMLRANVSVALDGVRLVRGEGVRFVAGAVESSEGLFLVPASRRIRHYDPLAERRSLLESFAGAPLGDEAALAALATRWGMLGAPVGGGDGSRAPSWYQVTVGAPNGTPGAELVDGAESAADWRAALGEWQDAFTLWGACSGSLPELLRGEGSRGSRLEVGEGRIVYRGAGGTVIDTAEWRGDVAKPITSSNKLPAARLVLWRMLASRVEELALPTVDASIWTGAMFLRVRNRSLLSALWLALAEEASAGLQARRCPRCRRWFVADPSQERRNPRTYCRPACQVAMAEKRSRARRLAAEGRKPAAIAEALGQEITVVRTWLKDSTRRSKRAANKKR